MWNSSTRAVGQTKTIFLQMVSVLFRKFIICVQFWFIYLRLLKGSETLWLVAKPCVCLRRMSLKERSNTVTPQHNHLSAGTCSSPDQGGSAHLCHAFIFKQWRHTVHFYLYLWPFWHNSCHPLMISIYNKTDFSWFFFTVNLTSFLRYTHLNMESSSSQSFVCYCGKDIEQ